MFSVYWHTLQVFWLPSLKIFLGLSFYGFFVIEFQKILIILSNILAFLPFGDLIRHVYTSVQFSWSVMSDSLWPHELQHARPPCPSPTPRVYPNSCSSSWWCHLILCHPLLILPSIFPNIRDFSDVSALCIRWPKYWSFTFNISFQWTLRTGFL